MTAGGPSYARQLAIIGGAIAFAVTAFDAINGFAGFLSIQPFATKTYVEKVVEETFTKTAQTEKDIQDRLVNLQLMSLEMSLQLVDGQLSARRGEQVDIQSRLIVTPNDLLLKKRLNEVASDIDALRSRRDLLTCYYDNLRGYKRECR